MVLNTIFLVVSRVAILDRFYCIVVSLWSFFSQSEQGDLIFSLGYLSSAERLTVVLMKARNLRHLEDGRITIGEYVWSCHLWREKDHTRHEPSHKSLVLSYRRTAKSHTIVIVIIVCPLSYKPARGCLQVERLDRIFLNVQP